MRRKIDWLNLILLGIIMILSAWICSSCAGVTPSQQLRIDALADSTRTTADEIPALIPDDCPEKGMAIRLLEKQAEVAAQLKASTKDE